MEHGAPGSGRGVLLPVLASLGVHGAILLIPGTFRIDATEGSEIPAIELVLSGPVDGGFGPASRAAADPSAVVLPPPAAPASAAAANVAPPKADPRPDIHRAAAEKRPAAVRAAPSPADVLEDAMALTASGGASKAGPASAPRRVEEDLGWEGSGRTLIRGVDPRFPESLAAAGVEAECEARITVSPAGNVVQVEITRGSGYIEIDSNVEAALRQFLFSRADSGAEAAGTVRFRFRLDRRE